MSLVKTALSAVEEAAKIHRRALPEYQEEHARLSEKHKKNIQRAGTAANFISNYAIGTVTKPIGMAAGAVVTAPALVLGPGGLPVIAGGIMTGRRLAHRVGDLATAPLSRFASSTAGDAAIHRAAYNRAYSQEDRDRLKELGTDVSKQGLSLAKGHFENKEVS